jgi:hypothetical protein
VPQSPACLARRSNRAAGRPALSRSPYLIDVAATPTNLHPQVAAVDPSQVRKPLREPRELGLPLGITFGHAQQYTDAPHPAGFLRARSERPRCGRTAEQRDERAAPHGLTPRARITDEVSQVLESVHCGAASGEVNAKEKFGGTKPIKRRDAYAIERRIA